MQSASEHPYVPSRSVPLRLADLAALSFLLMFAVLWPGHASPQFWSDPQAHVDILGADAMAYFYAVLNEVPDFTFERRPLFSPIVISLKHAYDYLFALSGPETVYLVFRTFGVLVPLLTYILARLQLAVLPGFALALFSASTMVVMFNSVAYETYGLTLAAGLCALIAASLFHRYFPAAVTRHGLITGAVAALVPVVAGWVSLTLLSVLLAFLMPPRAVTAPWRASLWGGLITGAALVLFFTPAMTRAHMAEIQGALAARYFQPSNLLSLEAWGKVLAADFVASLAYPGEVLVGSRFPGVVSGDNWMGAVLDQVRTAPLSWAIAVLLVGFMALSLKAAAKRDRFGYFVLALWLALGATVAFYVMWTPEEASLFAAAVWPYQIGLAIAGRTQISVERGRVADLLLLAMAIAVFARNFSVLNETAGFY